MFLDLTGTLQLGPGKQCDGNDGPLTGPVHPLALLDKNKAPKAQAGLFEQTVDSENAFDPLPYPSNLRATVTYIAPIDGAAFIVKFTLADNTTTELSLGGMALIEHNADNPVKGISVQGSGKLRWLATGTLA